MNEQIAVCSDDCIFRARYPCDEDVYNLSVLYMADHGWEAPTTAEEAMDLYCKLLLAFITDL